MIAADDRSSDLDGSPGSAEWPDRLLAASAVAIAALSLVAVLAPLLPWFPGAGRGVSLLAAFVPRRFDVLFPQLIGALVACSAALVVITGRGLRRLGGWIVAALALAGQVAVVLTWLGAALRVLDGPRHESPGIGWHLGLAVVVAGLTAIVLGALAAFAAIHRQPEVDSVGPSLGFGLIGLLVGLVTVGLLIQAPFFIGAWAFGPDAPTHVHPMARIGGLLVLAVGTTCPFLAVLLIRRPVLTLACVLGWWGFLAVPWAAALTDGVPIEFVSSRFWLGTACGVVGGALIAWWAASPGSGERRERHADTLALRRERRSHLPPDEPPWWD